MPVYREDLDHQGCNNPGCTEPACVASDAELGVRAPCHPKERGVRVSYAKAEGVIRLTCAVCGKRLSDIAVASAPRASVFIQ